MITLTNLKGGQIDVNVHSIVTLLDITGARLVAGNARCNVSTVDGKSFAVLETCEAIRQLIERRKEIP